MIKLKDLLFESQKFDIEGNKVEIIRIIDRIQKGGTINSDDGDIIYSIVTNTGGVGDVASIHKGYTTDDFKTWKSYFKDTRNEWNSNRDWSQRNINPEKKVKVDGKTYNYYITIDRNNRDNVIKFLSKIKFALHNRLKQFADKKGVAISYKTHMNLSSFLYHNDSLKVYYYDSSLKNDIESIVKSWVSDNNIKISDRSHTHGVDMNGKSYGQIVADTVLNKLVDIIKNHPNYSNEKYYEWFKKYFVDIIRSIKF